MSWIITPAGLTLQTINPLPHQRRIDATGVNIPFTNYSVATGGVGGVGRRSHVLYSIGEAQLQHEGLGAVLTTVTLPTITSTAPFAEGVGRTRGSAFIRLSDAHEARLKCLNRHANYPNGASLPIIGHSRQLHSPASEKLTYDYLALALVVNGTEVQSRIVTSLWEQASIRFGAWYVIDSNNAIYFCCGAWGNSTQRIPVSNIPSVGSLPTFGAGTFLLAELVDHSDVFVGLPRFGTYCDQTNFTGGGGGDFFIAAKSGLFTHARHATPDPPEALLARAGQGLASLRQDLSNFSQPLPAHSNTTGNVAYGQGIINIDNGGHPEYPVGRIGQFVVASHAYTTGEMGFLPTGVSNIGNLWEENQRLAQLRLRVTGPATGSFEGEVLDGQELLVDAVHGFNEYQGELLYDYSGQPWAFNAYATIHRADRVLPNNATGFTGVTASSDCFVNVSTFVGPTGASGIESFQFERFVSRALTAAQQADLFAGNEIRLPFQFVSGLDLLMQAVGPTGATAP
jgi:hypothetical protein